MRLSDKQQTRPNGDVETPGCYHGRMRLAAGTGVVFLALALSSAAAAKETVIDDFESGAALSSWTFYNGAEFPGATGTLTMGTGHQGKVAHLSYNFTAGGSYVSATHILAPGLTAQAVGFWVKAPAGIRAKLRVEDSSGQTLQYDLSRPLEASGASAWFRQVVDVATAGSHWGGANDGLVHQPLTAVTVLAADPLESGASGAIDFDDVVAIDTLALSLDATLATLVPAPSGAGDLAGRLAVNIHFTSDDRALDIARAAGFTAVRMDLGWAGIESKKGVYDFSAFDTLVASLASRSMRLHLILDYFNNLYPGAGSPDFAAVTVPAFAAVAQAATAHFAGKGVTYEVWNEPNGTGFWPPAPNAGQYAALCAATVAAVHRGDAAARVSTGGLAGFDFPFLRGYLAAGGGAGADAVGVHPYRQDGGESAVDELVLMRGIVAAALPAAPPVWDTEWGYSSTWYGDGHSAAARALQAQRVARELLSAWALGFPLVVYYDLRDDGTDATNVEHNFGLVQNDYTDKPAVVAVRTLTAVAAGRQFAGFILLEPSSLHAMVLDGPADRVVALWSDAPAATVIVTVPAGVTGIDHLGAAAAFTDQAGTRAFDLREADGPLYLTFPRTAAGTDGGAAPGGSDAGGGTGEAGTADASQPGSADARASAGVDGRAAPDAGVGGVDAASVGRDAGSGSVDAASVGQDAGSSAAAQRSGCGCILGGHGEGARAAPLDLLVLLLARGRAWRRRREPSDGEADTRTRPARTWRICS